MTPKEIIFNCRIAQFGTKKGATIEELNDPDLKFIFDAMEVYGKQEYNQAIDDLIADEVVSNRRDVIKKFKKL